MKLLNASSSCPAVTEEKETANYAYSPPQLESLYIDLSGTREDELVPSNEAPPESRSIDYTNFDVSMNRKFLHNPFRFSRAPPTDQPFDLSRDPTSLDKLSLNFAAAVFLP